MDLGSAENRAAIQIKRKTRADRIRKSSGRGDGACTIRSRMREMAGAVVRPYFHRAMPTWALKIFRHHVTYARTWVRTTHLVDAWPPKLDHWPRDRSALHTKGGSRFAEARNGERASNSPARYDASILIGRIG